MTDAQRIEGLQNALIAAIADAEAAKTQSLQVLHILDGTPAAAVTETTGIGKKLDKIKADAEAAIDTYGAS